MAGLDVVGGGHAGLFLEHAAEVGGIFEAELVGGFGYRQTGGKLVFNLADDIPPDLPPRAFARHLLYQVAEIVGRHAEVLGAYVHGRQTFPLQVFV